VAAARGSRGGRRLACRAVPRAVRLIVNPNAGGGRAGRLAPEVVRTLAALGLRVRAEATTSLEHARALARAARDAGELAAAMGGDGLTSAVAGELRGTDAVLGIVPGGRGNDFARKLGIPRDARGACRLLADGSPRAVDVALAAGRPYLGILSAGLDSDVQAIADATRLPLGRFVYAYGAVRALARWRPARWRVAIDGESRTFTGYSVAVANSGVFGGGMWLAPDARVDDGRLDVVLLGDRPRLAYLRALPKVFRGAHVHEPHLELLRGREVTVEADRPFTAYADGDPIAPLPVTVGVAHRALRVVAPR
jgi:YegS/Rv2252/BmrU family lipid kinase